MKIHTSSIEMSFRLSLIHKPPTFENWSESQTQELFSTCILYFILYTSYF
jgi:hypothetical protein